MLAAVAVERLAAGPPHRGACQPGGRRRHFRRRRRPADSGTIPSAGGCCAHCTTAGELRLVTVASEAPPPANAANDAGAAANGGAAPAAEQPADTPAVPAPAVPEPAPPPKGTVKLGASWSDKVVVHGLGQPLPLGRRERSVEVDPGTYQLMFELLDEDYSDVAEVSISVEAGKTQRFAMPIPAPARSRCCPSRTLRRAQ